MENSKKHHFVLVHGLGQGGWCWYKVKTMLESSGHQVTALDLAASGVNLKNISQVDTMLDYSEPLMDIMNTLPARERVILVGHSLGGLNIAYAMDKFPHKVSAAVFLAAFMPDTTNHPSYVIQKYLKAVPEDIFEDSQSLLQGNKTTLFFGPNFLRNKTSQLSPPEGATLGAMLTRVGSLFLEDMSTAAKFSDEGYGSVNRVYIVGKEDLAIPADFQRWMVKNYPGSGVKMIDGADHLIMISKPKEVQEALLDIANTYS